MTGTKILLSSCDLAIPLSKIWICGGASRTKTCSYSFVFRTEHVPEMVIFVAQLHSEDYAADAQECTQAMDRNRRLTENGLEGENFKTKIKVGMRQISTRTQKISTRV